ncbi:hypothetical protein, partial [Methanospirillum hungatei]|uniref:hypothetical protein n=1 Tax=Methanospirillum hungatei TaxID=2203 RepID=UPI002C7A0B77
MAIITEKKKIFTRLSLYFRILIIFFCISLVSHESPVHASENSPVNLSYSSQGMLQYNILSVWGQYGAGYGEFDSIRDILIGNDNMI